MFINKKTKILKEKQLFIYPNSLNELTNNYHISSSETQLGSFANLATFA